MFEIIDEIRPHKADRMLLREKVAVVLGAICTAVLLFLAVAWSTKAYAEPVLSTTQEGITVQLWTDACATAGITNLPYKATWHEKGKVTEGCWGARPDAGIVIFYFADKTVGIAPIQSFEKVVGV